MRAKDENGSLCWPTVVVQDSRSSAKHTTSTGVMHPGTMLLDAIRTWLRSRPDPTISSAGLEAWIRSHTTNPRFVEWLMGLPKNWTVPTTPTTNSAWTAFAHAATQSFQCKLHGPSPT